MFGRVAFAGFARTLRWRKPDSNRQYRVTEGFERDSCRLCLIRRQRKGDANESRCHDYGGVFRGTDGSNPAPSSRTSPASLADTGGQHRRRPMADFLESQRRQRAALLVDAVRSQTT